MNAKQREELSQIRSELEELSGRVSSIRDDEQDKLDNMPENMKSGDKGSSLENAVSQLDEAVSSLEDVMGNLEAAAE